MLLSFSKIGRLLRGVDVVLPTKVRWENPQIWVINPNLSFFPVLEGVAGVGLSVSLANNHIIDRGAEGLQETRVAG